MGIVPINDFPVRAVTLLAAKVLLGDCNYFCSLLFLRHNSNLLLCKLLVVFLSKPSSPGFCSFALVGRPLEVKKHLVRRLLNGLCGLQGIHHARVPRKLFHQERKLRFKVSNGNASGFRMGQKRLLPAPISPLGKPIPGLVVDKTIVYPVINGRRIIGIAVSQLFLVAVLEVHGG